MRKNSLELMKSIVVLAVLMPAAALANSHNGYSVVNVTPTTVSPGDYITIELEYTVTISDGYSSTSLLGIKLGGATGDVPWYDTGVELAEYTPAVNTGSNPPAETTVTLTGGSAISVQIPEDTTDGTYDLNIFSAASSVYLIYQTGAFAWYFLPGTNDPIQINVVSDPVVLVGNLTDTVVEMNLQQGIENSLDAKLDAALNALDDLNENNDQAAINSLYAFINAVEAQRGNKITDEQADILVADATYIIDLLSPE